MKIRTLLITGFALLAVLVAVMQIAAFQSLSSMTTTEKWLTHSYEVIGKARHVEKLMLDLETGMRGFLLTGDDSFMQPHIEADELYPVIIAKLKTCVSDNPQQVERLVDIEQLIQNWHESVSKPVVEQRRKIGGAYDADAMKEIASVVSSRAGKNFMDQIRAEADAFIAVEQEILIERRHNADLAKQRNRSILIVGTLLFFIFSILTLVAVLHRIFKQVGGEPAAIAAITNRIASGSFDIEASTGRETGILSSVRVMLESLKQKQQEIENQNWLNAGIAGLDNTMRGTKSLDVLCENIISYLARTLDVQVGTLSLANPDQSRLTIAGSYAFKGEPNSAKEFRFGDGLIGQAAQEKKPILIRDVKESHITIKSALGEIVPNSILCAPLLYEDEVKGVVELGCLHTFTDLQLKLLNQTAERIAIAIQAAQSRERMKKLLQESQTQAEELQAQQEELKVANEELEEKNKVLEEHQTQRDTRKREN